MFTRYLTLLIGGGYRAPESDAIPGGGNPPPPTTPVSATTPATTPVAPVTPASGTGTTAPTPPAASSTAPGTDDIPDGDWKRLRTAYEGQKAKTAALDALGVDYESIPDAVKTFNAIKTEAQTLAKEVMGADYDEADFKTAFAQDPAQLLAILRTDKAKAATPPPAPKPGETQVDYEKRIKDEVAAQTKPFTEHINRQISEQVVAKIGTETHAALETALPNAPKGVRDLVMDYVAEHLSSPANQNLIVAMKARGDYSSVKETVDFVAGRLKSVFKEWVEHETQRTGGRPTRTSPIAPVNADGSRKRFKLNDIIEDPSVLGDQYK